MLKGCSAWESLCSTKVRRFAVNVSFLFLLFLKPPPVYESEDTESTDEISLSEETPVKPQEFSIGPLPLSITRARWVIVYYLLLFNYLYTFNAAVSFIFVVLLHREILSWYAMSQNPNMSQVEAQLLHPVWVRCDMQDPANTSWLGAETVHTGTKATAIKLYTVSSKGNIGP